MKIFHFSISLRFTLLQELQMFRTQEVLSRLYHPIPETFPLLLIFVYDINELRLPTPSSIPRSPKPRPKGLACATSAMARTIEAATSPVIRAFASWVFLLSPFWSLPPNLPFIVKVAICAEKVTKGFSVTFSGNQTTFKKTGETTYGDAAERLNVRLPTGEFGRVMLKYQYSMSPGGKRIGNTGGVEVRKKMLYSVYFGEREIFAGLDHEQRRARIAHAYEAIQERSFG